MCPANSFDEATADMISDGVVDLVQQLIKIYYEKDETKKVMRKLMSVSVPHIQSLSGFTPEIANQSVFFFKSVLQSASRDIREFEQRRFWATRVNRKWTFCNVGSWFLTKFLADPQSHSPFSPSLHAFPLTARERAFLT